MQWAFMTANYVAKEVNYENVRDWFQDWGRCQDATINNFHNSRYAYKFEELIAEIKENGFNAVELWVGHLFPLAATPEMIKIAHNILDKYEMRVVSYTASFNSPDMSSEEGTNIFEIANAIGAPVIANSFDASNAPLIIELSRKYGIRFGLENHPEKSPSEIIEKIRAYYPWIGSTLDTGWFGTYGYEVSKAVHELKRDLIHVHLKDVLAAGSHDSCELGQGVVDIRGALKALSEIDYHGAITLEHEPYSRDPMPEMARSLKQVQHEWDRLIAQREDEK